MNMIRPWLFIGKYRDTLDRELLRKNQIGAILHLAERVQHPGITTLYLPVEDGVPISAEHLRCGIDFAVEQRTAGHNLLVACGAGISRSATFATAIIKETEQIDLLSAFGIVRQAHSIALPHYALWGSLCDYYGEEVPYLALLKR